MGADIELRAMAKGTIPEGFHTLTPYITVKDAKAAIVLYQRALGAEVLDRSAGEDGKIMNAQLRVGDSIFMLNDEFPEYGVLSPATIGGTGSTVHVYVEDVDELYHQMVDAGFKVIFELGDQFWGDRFAKLEDPSGHSWSIATRIARDAPVER